MKNLPLKLEAIELHNRLHKRKLLSKQLRIESKIVSANSLKVLGEFEKLNDADFAISLFGANQNNPSVNDRLKKRQHDVGN